MSAPDDQNISPEQALDALRAAKAKYQAPAEAHEAAKRHSFANNPYTPPPEPCTPAQGIPPTQCGAYKDNANWLPAAFVQNAGCACEKTPDSPSANAVRLTLQLELANTPEHFKAACEDAKNNLGLLEYEAWVAINFAPVAYNWHKKAYYSGCCKCGPAPFIDWVAVCAIPIPWCKLVDEAIDWFGSCHCTPGKW